jgi:N-acetylglucosamine-6-phosphate deacetylase
MTRAIIAERLFDGDQWHHNHCVVLEGNRISAVMPRSRLPATLVGPAQACATIAPGFIDLQVNGGGGVMLNNAPSMATVTRMADGHRRCGTTAILPTLISDTPAVHRAGVAAVAEAMTAGNAGVLGVHIEGPFFDLAKRGTHQAAMIRSPGATDISWLQSLTHLPVVLTLAPEQLQPGQIAQLATAGIKVCAGHTGATYEQVQRAFAEGLRGFTHLFNAMSPLHARAPGAVGAALDDESSWAGVIADGHHVHPATIRVACRIKPRGKLFLVSDAMATVGSEATSFDLYGERIEVREGKLINAEGALAGSAIGLIDAVRITHQQVGLPLEECLRMASLYPAEFLEIDNQLGRIRAGYRADLVHFDRHFTVLDTWVAGQHLQHRASQSGTEP